jgi:hypothetical protein
MVIREAFLAGTEPRAFCDLHGGGHPIRRFFSNLGSLFRLAR